MKERVRLNSFSIFFSLCIVFLFCGVNHLSYASTSLDADEDGFFDCVEKPKYLNDPNNGDVDNTEDLDEDGIFDFVEKKKFKNNHDNDKLKDNKDKDDDNDGLNDIDEETQALDHDNDGISDKEDLDDDEDGIADLSEASCVSYYDHDNDGEVDSLDEDDDNDGIIDEEDGEDGELSWDKDNDGIGDKDDINGTEEIIGISGSLPGYPITPPGKKFSESFNNNLNEDLFEIKDGYSLWDSWLTLENVSFSDGNLKLSSNANDTFMGLLKVGGLISTKFYSYGKFIFRAKANPTIGTVSSIYLYNEDKDKDIGGRHEEIDVELSSKFKTRASLVTYHNDNWQNDDLQNEMHRGGIKDISEIKELENFDSSQFNVYVIDWQPGKITWYVNGVKAEEFTNAIPTTPMMIHLDTNTNKQWDAFINTTPSGSGELEIDYINYEPY